MAAFGSGASAESRDAVTPVSSLPEDLGETINIDGAMPEPRDATHIHMADVVDPLDRVPPPTRDDDDDPQRTISLDIPAQPVKADLEDSEEEG